MPKRLELSPHASTQELERRYRKAKDPVERSHHQIVWLLSGGRTTKSAFQNPVGDRRVASKDGQISASIPLFWACSDPHRHLEWRF